MILRVCNKFESLPLIMTIAYLFAFVSWYYFPQLDSHLVIYHKHWRKTASLYIHFDSLNNKTWVGFKHLHLIQRHEFSLWKFVTCFNSSHITTDKSVCLLSTAKCPTFLYWQGNQPCIFSIKTVLPKNLDTLNSRGNLIRRLFSDKKKQRFFKILFLVKVTDKSDFKCPCRRAT